MSEFKNKVVVVTGGNSGIGKTIAKKFNQQGARVVIFGRNAKTLKETQAELHQALAIKGDVTKLKDLENLFKETKKHFGKIDVLIANAGIAALNLVDDVDEKFFDDLFNTNFKGAYFTVQRSVPYLNKGASIVLISSMAAHCGLRAHSVYSSTKAAVSQLAKNFSADLIERGIRVNAISPGFTDTPIFTDRNRLKKLTKLVPLNRAAKPEEIANLAIYLSSRDGAYIVGQDIVIDGGVSAIFQRDK